MMEARRWRETRSPFLTEARCLVSPDPRADAPLVVLLHGMGEDPERAVAAWPRVAALPVHVLAPAGPYPRERTDEGARRVGHAWYLVDGDGTEFRRSLYRAEEWLHRTIADLESAAGIAPRARGLVGYSQGAYFAYVAALRRQDRYSHLAVVAGRLKERFVERELARPGPLRVLALHGEQDRAVLPEASERSVQTLREAGYAVEHRVLPGGHALHPDRDEAAAAWLAEEWGLPRR